MRVLLLVSIVFCIIVLAQPSLAAGLNPKSVSSTTITIAKSGTLTPSGGIQSASLTLYIAQEGQQSIDVSPSDWEYVNDANGNRMVRIHFKSLSQPQSYSLTQTVKTNEQMLASEPAIDSGTAFTEETNGSQITTNISATAYPFEKSLKGVAGMAAWVHGYVTYDISLFDQNKPSDWVLANRRGVCVEFSNLLAAMLRSKGIPVRYVNGYAYSSEDSGFIGHEWVEVLAGGAWVGFDPTWLEGGLIDATHIRTSVSADGLEKETLSYFGSGSVDWNKDSDNVSLADYSTSNKTSIIMDAPDSVPLVGGGFIKAVVSSSGCMIESLDVSSCKSSKKSSLLDVEGGSKAIWFCGSASAYWAFTNSLSRGYTYSCPVTIYDQSDGIAEGTISIGGEASGPAPSITGPDSAGVSRPFTIQASGRLFSTELGEAPSNSWTLTIREEGTYHFYSYANGRLASHEVEVKSVQDIDVSAAVPATVNQSASFIVTAGVRNTGGAAKAVSVKASFGNQTSQQDATLDAGQSRSFDFNFTAYDAGDIKYSVAALSDTFAGYSGMISVIPAPPKPAGILDSILSAIQGFIEWLMTALGMK